MKKQQAILCNLAYLCTCILLLQSCAEPVSSNIHLPALFNNNMVLQQNTKVTVWGKAAPTTDLNISGTWGASTSTKTNDDGTWTAQLETPKAGGPYELSIAAHDTTWTMKNILIGEVWLCSGQSNMEMPLAGWPPNELIVGSEQAIQQANFDQIRMFTVQRKVADTLQSEGVGDWVICSPETAGKFSAMAFFFGRKLHESLQVPIGLIHSSWGGTPAEAWTEGKHLTSLDNYKNIFQQLAATKPQRQAFDEWKKRLKTTDVSALPHEQRYKNLNFNDQNFSAIDYDDSNWLTITLPTTFEQSEMGAIDGVVWFRTTVDIPADQVNKEWVLALGSIDDMDATFVNGQQVEGYEALGFYNVARVYDVPTNILKEGKNTLAVKVIDTGGEGGFFGEGSQMKLYPKDQPNAAISLAKDWRYLPVAEYDGLFYEYGGTLSDFKSRPKVDFPFGSNTPTALYNGMIAPLIPYTIKGAIWYQGESNVGRAEEYQSLFPVMIKSWRKAWNLGDFPFYYVQIAPFNYGNADGIVSAELRDAQRLSLSTPNTGMVVTLDIGDIDNIHPGNKREVGERLALWALAKDYDQKNLVYSGPIFAGMETKDQELRISFANLGSGLRSKTTRLTGFEIAGADGKFIEVEAMIQGDQVVLRHPNIPAPKMARYAFKNGSVATLFNQEDLPASSFSVVLE